MISEMNLAILAILISCLSALYTRWSAIESKKANDIGTLNALLSLRTHYLALMEHEVKMADFLKNHPSGLQAAQDTYADLDQKLGEVNRDINAYHAGLVKSHS